MPEPFNFMSLGHDADSLPRPQQYIEPWPKTSKKSPPKSHDCTYFGSPGRATVCAAKIIILKTIEAQKLEVPKDNQTPATAWFQPILSAEWR